MNKTQVLAEIKVASTSRINQILTLSVVEPDDTHSCVTKPLV